MEHDKQPLARSLEKKSPKSIGIVKHEPVSKWKMIGTMNAEEVRMNSKMLQEIAELKREGKLKS